MTGKDLAIYILQNNYGDKDPFAYNKYNDRYDLFLKPEDVAARYGVGPETVVTWYNLRLIDGIKIGDQYLFPNYVKDPREKFRTVKERS